MCWPDCEPNDSFDQAQGPLGSADTYQGHIESEADQNDYYYFDMPAAHTVELWLRNIPDSTNYHLYLYDANTNLRGYSGNPGNAEEHILTDTLPAGRYFVRIQRVTGYSATQPYSLQATFQ